MAFPGTYNINYYKGDTLEFKIYPKIANGDPFLLTPFVYDHDDNLTTADFDSSIFAFAETTGGSSAVGYHECYAKIADNGTYVLCAIRPDDASYLTAGKTYVYDVQVSRPGLDYPMVVTLLSGTITVTDQVSE
jgi:hypothetical protein